MRPGFYHDLLSTSLAMRIGEMKTMNAQKTMLINGNEFAIEPSETILSVAVTEPEAWTQADLDRLKARFEE